MRLLQSKKQFKVYIFILLKKYISRYLHKKNIMYVEFIKTATNNRFYTKKLSQQYDLFV